LPELPCCREGLWYLARPFVHEAEFEDGIKSGVVKFGNATLWNTEITLVITFPMMYGFSR
jgi:hypothetical protein